MDLSEIFKRIRRVFDGNFSSRKTILIILGILAFLLYLLPSLWRMFFSSSGPVLPSEDIASQRVAIHLSQYHLQAEHDDVNILHSPPYEGERAFLPYVGNGFIGVSIDPESSLYIRNGRTLSLPIKFRPIVSLSIQDWQLSEATVTDYRNGIVTKYQSWYSASYGNIDISYQVYAHRVMPSLLIQDIKITNPTSQNVIVDTDQLGLNDWSSSTSSTITIQHGNGEHEYLVIKGTVSVPGSSLIIPVSLVTLKVPPSIQVKAGASTTLHIVSSIDYSEFISADAYSQVSDATEEFALKSLKEAVTGNTRALKDSHTDVWRKLSLSGFGISPSKAENALNGDVINATIYYVLSQSSAPLYEVRTSASKRAAIFKDLEYSEGCFGGHSTLMADTLWSNLKSLIDINHVVELWMMTLQKKGCHQLLRAGADGVLQGMILSFGVLQFKNQHLEFNADPQNLHRDYHFRRLSYGNSTHLNISVIVQEEDYKAVIYTALDRSDKNYYACDAGCLDKPVQLGQSSIMFPIKKTDPLTAILYITSDPIHMEELKHTIHVKEIAMAPPHEHHVMAMHRHGHKWGGLPTVFWMTIIALIVIFHLFLFKLVINEYCGPDLKVRYRKFSDF